MNGHWATLSIGIFSIVMLMIIPVNAFADEFPYLYNRHYTEPPQFCLIQDPAYAHTIDQFLSAFMTGMENWEEALAPYPGTWDMEAHIVENMEPQCTIKVEFTTTPLCGDNIFQGCASANWIGMRIFPMQSTTYFTTAASHEIGHTMALGHYETDSPDKKAKWARDREWPSIMVSGGGGGVTSLDVGKIVSLYQATEDKPENGFWHFGKRTVKTPPGVEPPTVTPPVIVKPPPLIFSPVADMHVCYKDINGQDECSKDKLEVLRGRHYVPTMILISGFLNEEHFIQGLPLWMTITEPLIVVKKSDEFGNEYEIYDYPTNTHKVRPTKDRYFELPMMIDHLWALGFYKIQVTYRDNTDSEKDVFFELVDEKTQTETKEIITKSDYPVVKNEVPEWFKQNTEWWLDGQIDEETYLRGVTSVIDLGLINIPQQVLLKNKQVNEELSAMRIEAEYVPSHEPVPAWYKTTSKWWAEGKVEDRDYLLSIEYLIKNNIIKLEY